MTYELEPGVYTCKDLSEALFKMLQPKTQASSNVTDIKFDDNTMKNNWL